MRQKQRSVCSHEHGCHCHEHVNHDHSHHAHEHSHTCAHCEARLNTDAALDRGAFARILIAVALFALALALPAQGAYSLLLYLIPYLIVGYDVLFGAIRNLFGGRVFDEQFLMTLATVGAFCIGEYPEGVAVMLFYQVGELLQGIAVGKSRRRIAALMDIRPDTAVVLREGEEITLSPDQVRVGEILIVRPGEKIALDGRIMQGETTLNNAFLTGESLPQRRCVGELVNSGAVNLTGVVYIKVEKPWTEGTVSRILALMEEAAEKKASPERFITRFSRYYTPAVVIIALLLSFIPWMLFGEPLAPWVYRALSFLVISCPCALVISVPLSFFGGIAAASSGGVLIKGASCLEQLSRTDTLVLDKTGTLTKGEFSVTHVDSPVMPVQELLGIAAALEQYSLHPIAQGIVRAYGKKLLPASDYSERAGKGVTALVRGVRYAIGNAELMRELGVLLPPVKEHGSVIYICSGQHYLGCFVVCDEVKPNAAHALALLKRQGVGRIVMLTGDTTENARSVGEALGIGEIRAQLLPSDKVAHLEALLGEDRCVAFVGDGINDAPVLARADVGIAMGGIGSDVAIESADAVLMRDDLSALPFAFGVARKTMRIVRQNIALALAAKAVILLLAAFGIAGMWIAVFGDVGVMLLAVCNAIRATAARS